MAAVVVGAACGDHVDQLPTDAPSFVVNPACDFKTISDGVRAVFPSGTQTTALETVRAMEDACDAANQAAVTDLGLSVLALLETEFYGGTLTGTVQQQAQLVTDVLSKAALPVPAGAVLTEVFSGGGLFGVRGGANDPNTTPVLSNGNAILWGVAPAAGSNFRTMTAQTRILIVGYPAEDFTDESDFNSFYHFFRTPAVVFSPEAILGACIDTPDDAVMQKEGTVLNYTGAPSFCPAVVPPPPTSSLGSVLQFAGNLLFPKPLQAAALGARGGSGGAATFSRAALITVGQVNAGFTADGQPADAIINTNIKSTTGGFIKVQVLADGGAGIELARVVITAHNNNGNTVRLLGDADEFTEENGIATFEDLKLNKTGRYILRAAITFSNPNIPPMVVNSNQFIERK